MPYRDVTAKPTRGALSVVGTAAVTPVGADDAVAADRPAPGRFAALRRIGHALWPFRPPRRDVERGQEDAPTENTALLPRS